MKHQPLSGRAGTRSFLLVFDAGDEVSATLSAWCVDQGVTAATFTGIGAFRAATLGYFVPDRRTYERIDVGEQVEVLSLAGNVALAGNEPKVHAHVVLGTRDGAALGGHLLEGVVRPTLELVLVESDETMQRRIDPNTGLPLLRVEGESRTERT